MFYTDLETAWKGWVRDLMSSVLRLMDASSRAGKKQTEEAGPLSTVSA